MLSISDYNAMILKRITQATRIAEERGLLVATYASSLKLVIGKSSATLLFRSDHIFVEEIKVHASERQQRRGSDILNVIAAIADDAGLRLELVAESPLHLGNQDLSQNHLEAWYRRHAFLDLGNSYMSRNPVTTPIAA